MEGVFAATIDSLQLSRQNPNSLSSLEKAATQMSQTPGRVILTGMGKSGLIARKVAATLTSTGSPSVFLHPADALHGDVGNVQKKEVVLAFSNSGETREIVELLPHLRRLGSRLIAVTGKETSTLAQEADTAITYTLTREGCPLELAPMASTTISLMIGDALSAALIKLKNFKREDFGLFHPSGALGQKLLTRVKNVMQSSSAAFIQKSSSFSEIVTAMVSSNLGCVLVLGSKGHVRGIISDGDLKRILSNVEHDQIWQKTALDIMSENPTCIDAEALVEAALHIMTEKKVYTLPVIDRLKKPVGIVRMHDIVQ